MRSILPAASWQENKLFFVARGVKALGVPGWLGQLFQASVEKLETEPMWAGLWGFYGVSRVPVGVATDASYARLILECGAPPPTRTFG